MAIFGGGVQRNGVGDDLLPVVVMVAWGFNFTRGKVGMREVDVLAVTLRSG